VLIYLADEDLGEKNSVFVPFFGVQKATIPVLGRLTKSCDAVVLPCVSCYEPENRRYSIRLLPEIKDFPSGDDVQDSASMNRAIEAAIMHCPIQYLWTLRYFKTRPPGEASVYD
jgi:lauroyl-KDO2-lipid IV(A) myristoyltransferase